MKHTQSKVDDTLSKKQCTQNQNQQIIELKGKGNSGTKGMRERSQEGPRLNQDEKGKGNIEAL